MRRFLIVLGLAAALTVGVVGSALADGPVGNSGHSNNGSTQCQAGGQDHCPPFGNDK